MPYLPRHRLRLHHLERIKQEQHQRRIGRQPFHLAPQQLGEFEVLSVVEGGQENRKVALLDFLPPNGEGQLPVQRRHLIPFESAWELQKQILEAHVDRLQLLAAEKEITFGTDQFIGDNHEGSNIDALSLSPSLCGKDTIIFLQHQPVYTLGTASDEKFITAATTSNDNQSTVPVVRMDRGGEVTYHGPGQLTVYPILDLRGYKQDIHWYIRALEEAVILALSHHGLQAERQEGITGVWVQNRKVAAVGIKCRKWITMHGLAVNVEEESLPNFDGIVACGLENRKVGCVNQFLTNKITISEFSETLKWALEQVFQIELLYQNNLHYHNIFLED